MHIEFLVEEPSSEKLLTGLLPQILPPETDFHFITFRGKPDLLANLQSRLEGYAEWIPSDYKIVVLIDEDRQNCAELKDRLETAASNAGLRTKTASPDGFFTVLNQIAVEELEAWYFGDRDAVVAAFPKLSKYVNKSKFRNPDAIEGGTWEQLERILIKEGYYKGRMPKVEMAEKMSQRMLPARNQSRSFQVFVSGLQALAGS